MFEKLKKILAKQLRVDEAKIKPESRIREDLGADSLDVLQLLMNIEEDYDIIIPDDKLTTFVTVQDIVNYFESIK